MPVTVRLSSRIAESWGKQGQLHGSGRYVQATSPEQLLSSTTSNDDDDAAAAGVVSGFDGSRRGRGGRDSGSPRAMSRRTVFDSSFADRLDRRTSTTFATKNGLVHACIEAYNEHHNLVLRPDDVWFAILTQLSAYVNANAADLRSNLVGQHETSPQQQQNHLHIDADVSAPNFDHGAVVSQMGQLLGTRVRDPALRDWILPAFSTTRATDQAVASIIFMGTMQKYFTYSWGTRCGIPAVTLLGDAADWDEIARRCESRLSFPSSDFGPGPAEWYRRVLRPVLTNLAGSFRDPDGPAARRFWAAIVDQHRPNGSGRVTYSGWITAFCYWDEAGRCLHPPLHPSSGSPAGAGGGVVSISRSDVPVGFAKVPVTLLDGGARIPVELLAGSLAMRVTRSGRTGRVDRGQ
ncbi:hypothetical protein B0T26DRAFT_742727 [Lasiosphaeria miniovina]|uniref:DUF4419 domain-containing protein n=1 Tax=Lasiosphaeria miniovina TaxID=1954250 RepID=A0AA40A4R0_9PEZI|nr:uncharacterized protein B0T26DRAFT_742727 [Lasiosphaeria miniovina]KAK0709155.1 hypothetical protein B0T26DRAFT_742727 [Lasiosphaeria miniovina]